MELVALGQQQCGSHFNDTLALDIVGIDTVGTQHTLYTAIQPSQMDFNLNISPYVYPKLFLRCYMEDSVFRTPPQLNRWQIYYQEVPEAVLNPLGAEFISADVEREIPFTGKCQWRM
ncbi:MAG: hypothetical protein R2847_12335 [Bacteroidia bacterium]